MKIRKSPHPVVFKFNRLARPAPGGGRRKMQGAFLAALAISASLLLPHAAKAGQDTWTGAGDVTWGNGPNWSSGSAPGAANDAVFDTTSFTNAPSVTANASVLGLIFSGAPGITFGAGTSTLTLGADGILVNAGAGVITTSSAKFALLGNQSWVNNSSSLLTISGAISASSGSPILTLTGTGSGGITLRGAPSGAVGIVVDSAGPVTFNFGGSVTYSGGTTIKSGTLISTRSSGSGQLGSGLITLGDNTSGNSNNATLIFNGSGGATIFGSAITLADKINTTGTLTIGASITSAAISSNITGNNSFTINNGATTGALSFSGTMNNAGVITNTGTSSQTTLISGAVGSNVTGIVQASGSGALTVSATNGVTIGSGGLAVSSTNTAKLFTLSANVGGLSGGNLIFNANGVGNITASGTINHNGLIVNSGVSSGTTTISGTIGSNVTGVTQNSVTSLLVLSGNNSGYAGQNTITSGTLQLGNANALGTGNLAVDAGTLDLHGNSVSVGLLSGTGSGGVITSSTTGAVTFTTGGSGISTYAGVIQNGSGTVGLTKGGSGNLVLTGSHTYTGATVVGSGTLSVNGSIGVSSGVTVSAGATLGGSGKVSAITGAGTVAPGNSPGILTAPSVTVGAGGESFKFELTATGNPTWSNATNSGNDVLHLTGATPINGTADSSNVFDIYLKGPSDGVLTVGDIYVGGIFTDNNSDFATLLGNATYNYYVLDSTGGISYNGNNYDLVSPSMVAALTVQIPSANFADGTVTNGWAQEFQIIPEPGTWGMILSGFGMLIGFQRLRKRRVGI